MKFVSGAQFTTHENPLRGPAGEPLYTDIARIGAADATKLVIFVSSTHGIERYLGSECHARVAFVGQFGRQAGADAAVLFVRAVNPFGFAWGRRTKEGNVDLNRNSVDHAKSRPADGDCIAIVERGSRRAV